MAAIPTVKVVSQNKDGYTIINKKDFTNKDRIFKKKPVAKRPKEDIDEKPSTSH